MKRSLAATAVVAAIVLAGCSEREPAEVAASANDAAAVETAAAPSAEGLAPSSPAAGEGAEAAPAAAGAPAFAVIYPGGALDGAPTLAEGPDGPGGIIAFTTDATPAEVIGFYRQRAETAGLKSINTMNRGNSMGYGAGDGAGGRGQTLSVVATRVEGEPTSVQLSWTAGR